MKRQAEATDPDTGTTDPDTAATAQLTAAEGAPRPWTVSVAGALTYVLAAACLARGAADPSASDGTGASGIGLIVLGAVELALVTLAMPGRVVARACLCVALVVGGIIVITDDTEPSWFRIIALVLALGTVVLMVFTRPSRRYFGDDKTPLSLS